MVDAAVIISCIGFSFLVPMLILASHRIERTEGCVLRYHLRYAAFVVVGLLVVPESVQSIIYSPFVVLLIGSVFPIYESVRAVCTPGGDDDKSWLMYWISYGVVAFPTAWVNDIAQTNDALHEHWYEFEFFFFLWLLLPWTDGACLLYQYVGKPIFAPWIIPLTARCDTFLSGLISTIVSASHLWVLWAIFLFFPASWKRFLTVAVGVVFPLMASLVAVTTDDTYEDDTFWLTYWSCYGCLYLIMDFLETWLGGIPGFYTIVLFSSVYLMLPIFRGADKVFRNILVPLTGLQEMLLVRDALVMKRAMMKQLTPEQGKRVRNAVAASFSREDDNDDEETCPLLQYGSVNIV